MDTCIDDSVIYTPSASWQYRKNKPPESCKSRVSYSTVGWIRKQSPLERFFYVIVLFVILCLVILIYLSYIHVKEDSNPLEAVAIHDKNIINKCDKKCDTSSNSKQGVNETATTKTSINKSTLKTSLCSLIGLNHLISTKPLFNNTKDYYWFRPGSKLPEDNINRVILKDTFSLQDLTKNWSMECALKKGSFWCKIKLFWESCLKRTSSAFEKSNSYDMLLQKLELKNEVNNLNIQKLFNILEENGQSNGLYYYKPLFVHPSREKIFLVGRDNYPHYSEESLLTSHAKIFASKLNRLISSNNVTYQEMNEILAWDVKLTKLKSLRNSNCSDEGNTKCYQYDCYQLHEYRNQFESVHKPDYIIEYPHGYIEYLQKHLPKVNLKFYFLWINYKTNMFHINSSSFKSFNEFFESSRYYGLISTCRDMLKLPFGLVLLRRMIEMNSNNKLSDSSLSSIISDEIIGSLNSSWLRGYEFSNAKLTQLFSKLIENIKHLITKEKIQFDEYLTNIYDQLELTDNYFDNVQAIRTWLKKGYREGCILNLASI